MASFCMLVRVGVLGFVDLLKLRHSEKDLGLELDVLFWFGVACSSFGQEWLCANGLTRLVM